MDAPIAETKVGDLGLEGVGDLQTSVSFGKYANDSLSWEKWSTFPSNKYLDEVEKCSSAGSVAQKAAFFEAHYKNVAARKAEQEGQDKKGLVKEGDHRFSDDQTRSDSMCDDKVVEGDLAVNEPNGQNPVDESMLEVEVTNLTIAPSIVDAISEVKDQFPVSEVVEDESFCVHDSPELHKSEECVVIREEAPKEKKETIKSEKSMLTRKATTAKRATVTNVVKKKPVSSTPNSSVTSTPKISRPALSRSFNSESKVSSKKESDTTPLTSRKPNRAESRRVAPTPLSMSLNLGAAKSEPAISATMRKSLLMERMGDKDIVKRVFKAFQNNFNQVTPSGPAAPSAAREIVGEETDTKASLTSTPQKLEGGSRLVKKASPLSGHPGPRKTSNSPRVPNTVNADQRSSKYDLRSHGKSGNEGKTLKKLEERVNGQAAERTRTDKNGAEIERPQQRHDAKGKKISRTAAPKNSSCNKDAKG